MLARPGHEGNSEVSSHETGDLTEAKSALKSAEAALVESWQVSEQLLLSGLREHELADQLRRQLAFYSALASSLGEGVFAVNFDGRITFVNPAAEQMLGQTEADLLGSDAYQIIHLQDSDDPAMLAPSSPLLDVMRDGTTYRTEEALFNRSGEGVFLVAYVAAPIQSDGQTVGAVVSFRDITEIKRLQRTRDEYIALLSHDLRTPLTSILGFAQLLHHDIMQRGLTKEARWAETLITNGQRMNSMIEEVLERNFRETGGAAQPLVTIDLVQLCQRMAGEIGNPTETARIHLHAAAPLPVLANPIQIERVIVNLLSNALKYSTPESPVIIRVWGDDQYARVAITDEGIGIDERDLPQLFDKFYRTHTVRAIEGSGLGLYGSRLIVEAHGGRIWAESELGVGSTFSFLLPINRA